MANITTYKGGAPIIRAAGGNNASVPDHIIMSNVIDATDLAAAAAISDTLDILEIPANTEVTGVYIDVIEAEASVTLALGVLGGDVDGFVEAVSIATTGVKRGAGALIGAAGGFLATDTMLSATVAGAVMDSAKFRVVVTGVNIG